MFLVAA
jgi:hypothetical protein